MQPIAASLILAWLSIHGYDKVHADAVALYLHRESGFEPCVENRTGHYIAQWVGVRLRELSSFAGVAGCPRWEVQMEFLNKELRSGRYERFWRARRNVYAILRRTFGEGKR